MKTAISIPDNVFKSAERLASRMGQSRSHLYTQAISNYIAKHQKDNVTKELDALYGPLDSTLGPGLTRLQSKSLPKDEW